MSAWTLWAIAVTMLMVAVVVVGTVAARESSVELRRVDTRERIKAAGSLAAMAILIGIALWLHGCSTSGSWRGKPTFRMVFGPPSSVVLYVDGVERCRAEGDVGASLQVSDCARVTDMEGRQCLAPPR